ncbi:MAG: glycosyltransferase [Parachlamydiaceae bacterium]
MKIQKVDVLLPTYSQYQVQHHFTRKLYEAFVRAGCETRLLDGTDRVMFPILSHSDVTIAFNGGIKTEAGTLLCDHIKIPHISCLVDPPYRFLELTKGAYSIITCDDQLGCSFLKDNGFNQSFFMPHAVEPELTFDPLQERIYDVVFLGTCIDCEARRALWKDKFPSAVCRVMDEAIEATFADDITSFITILASQLDPWMHHKVFEEVEIYVKGRERLDLLNAVHGCTVHVFGNNATNEKGWAELLVNNKNVVVHPSVSYNESIEIMKQSKVVLNSSIKNKLGAHERIFTAAACGAVVVTNKNPYIADNFAHGIDMLLYSRTAMSGINDEVLDLLSDEKKRSQMAASGTKRVMQFHTWDCRVNTLLAYMSTVR